MAIEVLDLLVEEPILLTLDVIDENAINAIGNVTLVPGPQGPAGADGAQGPQGEQGIQGIQGENGRIENVVINGIPTGDIDNSNADFYTADDFQIPTLEVYLNGCKQFVTKDFTTIGTTQIRMTISPEVGDFLTVNYIKLY
jgi:hypothetical protein